MKINTHTLLEDLLIILRTSRSVGEFMSNDNELDISGLDCAVPFFKLTEAVASLKAGGTIRARTQKSAMQNDMPSYCRQKNLQLLEQGEDSGWFYFVIKKPA